MPDRNGEITLRIEDYNRLTEAAHAARLASMMARPADDHGRSGQWRLTQHYVERLQRAATEAEKVVL